MTSQTIKYITVGEAADKFNIERHELEFAVNDSVDGTILLQRKHHNHGGDFQGYFQLIKNSRVWNDTELLRLAFWKNENL